MIWSCTFRPQMISLQYANYLPTPHKSRSVENDGSHLKADSTPNSSPPPSPGQLEPIDAPAPIAFSVCRASRAIAQSRSYRTWRMIRSDGNVRGLLWDPLIDTIFFAGPHDSYFSLFVQQFSAQASEIRSLALPHSFWEASFATKTRDNGRVRMRRGSRELLRLLKSPSSLQELFVLVDKEFFDSEVKGKAEDQMVFWTGPECFGRGFLSGLKSYHKAYGVDSLVIPKISIAWSFDMILRGEAVELPGHSNLDSIQTWIQEWRSRNIQRAH